jgi:hypothetical protein
MTMQSEKGHGLASNLPLQVGAVIVVAAILIVLAANYIW